jgi:RNA polymerase sigma factor (sigma-70 family)
VFNVMNDSSLLQRFATAHDEAAFTALVERHLNMVYFSALRRTGGNTHRAEEIAQHVFALLARKARRLARHPALPGWLHTTTLYTARELARAEARRLAREQKAQVMHEISSVASREVNWDEIRPLIDDTLRELPERDRAAILLRFFENRRYAEIGAELRITENSARMRVERAMEKLREALGRRGVTSTAAALGTALAAPAAMAAPAGLAQHIATAAVASAGSAGALSFFTVLQLMTSAKTAAISAGVIAVLALGVAVQQHRELQTLRSQNAALEQKQAQTQTLVDSLESRLAVAYERAAQRTSADGHHTGGAAAVQRSDPHTPPPAITRDMVEARLKKAQELAKSGNHAAALEEYLWCYDTGMRQVDGYFLIRYSSLLGEIAALGKSYPPALDALRVRRDAAEQRLAASGTDMAAGKDFGSINRVLGENERTFALFDSLAEDDPRRAHIVDTNIGRLMEARRYRELAKAMPYDDMPQVWEQMSDSARAPAANEAARQARLRSIIEFGASQVELRAGAGDIVHASDMLERLLILDNSPETIASIKRHLERAGHPELADLPTG